VLVQAKVRFCISSGSQVERCGWMAAHNEGKDTTGFFFKPPTPPHGLFQFRIDSGCTNLTDELGEHFGQRLTHPRPSLREETTGKNHKHCHMNAW